MGPFLETELQDTCHLGAQGAVRHTRVDGSTDRLDQENMLGFWRLSVRCLEKVQDR